MTGSSRRTAALGLLAVLSVIAGPTRAKAEILVGDTTVMPVSDPVAEIDLPLLLPVGDLLKLGDFITFKDVPDVDPRSMIPINGIPQPNPNYLYFDAGLNLSGAFTITTAPGTGGGTDITLTFTAKNITFVNSDLAPSAIGDLFVVTTVDFNNVATSGLLDPLHFTSQSHGSDGSPSLGSGTTSAEVVPEPASLALLGLGLGSATMFAARRRRVGSRVRGDR